MTAASKITKASKIDKFPNCEGSPGLSKLDAQNIAGQFKALAHPVRLQILQYLGNQKSCCCNDFCAGIPLAQSTISQHLKILSEAGIIVYKPVGNCSNYSLNPIALKQAENALAQVGKLAQNLPCDDNSPNVIPASQISKED